MFLQLVAIYCQGMIPGLLPLVWSIVLMKVRSMLSSLSCMHLGSGTRPLNSLTLHARWLGKSEMSQYWLCHCAAMRLSPCIWLCTGHASSKYHVGPYLDDRADVLCQLRTQCLADALLWLLRCGLRTVGRANSTICPSSL